MTQPLLRNPFAQKSARVMAAAEPAPASPTEDDRRIGVIVYPDAIGGRLSIWDRCITGAARRLADQANLAVLVITRDDFADDLGSIGADAKAVLGRDLSVEQSVAVLCEVFQSIQAEHLVFPDSEAGGDLGRRIAARLGTRPNTTVWRIQGRQATSMTGSRRGAYETAVGRVLLIADGAEQPYCGEPRVIRPVPLNVPPSNAGSPVSAGPEWRLPPGEINLQDAELVIGGGLGVADWSTLKQVASNLGASFGASRPVIDKGELARSRQIGATGSMLGARCYIALGISGAPQHLEGLKSCDFVIGVNVDKDAPIARRADIFIQADADGVLHQLAALTGEAK